MQISCTNCKTQYKINEAKIPAKPTQVKCKKCNHDIIISNPGEIASPVKSSPKKIRQSFGIPTKQNKHPEVCLINAAMAFLLWTKLKENPKLSKKLKKVSSQLFNNLKLHEFVIHVNDKDAIFEKFMQTADGILIKEGKISDSALLQYIKFNLKNFSPADISKYIKLIMFFVFEDKVLSKNEREALYILCDSLKISRASIDQLIQKFKKDRNLSKQVIQNERIVSGKQKLLAGLAGFIGILAIAISVLGYYQYQNAKNAFSDFNLQLYIEENPKLVFKKIYFSKYIIYGKPQGTNKKFEKLYIYLANGNADFQFDLTKLDLNEEETDFVTKTLVMTCSEELPIEIDVNIPQKDFVQIDELEAAEISESEAVAMAKLAMVPAALAGGYAGAKFGSAIGGAIYKVPVVGSAVGGITGGVIGSGAAATGAYIMTKNFLTGLHLESNTLGEKDQLYSPAKRLIALELMGGTELLDSNWDEKVKQYYQKELINRISNVFKSYGWENIRIDYKS
jgi:predicted Zn finger-like uncharacterized protein